MTELLFNFHLAQVYADNAQQNYRNQQVMRHELVDGLLEQKGLDRETFYESYVYYVEHPVMLDSIYERVYRKVAAYQLEYGNR